MSRLIVIATLVALNLHAAPCNVTGHYRCKNGSTGAVVGRGENVETAKIAARDRAREICNGMVDYVRFGES